jgi:hypothetical protein
MSPAVSHLDASMVLLSTFIFIGLPDISIVIKFFFLWFKSFASFFYLM